jgi:predicted nucleotide-binding protein
MAPKKRSTPTPEAEEQAQLVVPRSQADQRLQTQIDLGTELLGKAITSLADYEERQNEYYSWLEYSSELLRRIFSTEQYARELDDFSIGRSDPRSNLGLASNQLHEDVQRKVRRLASIQQRLELITVSAHIQPVDVVGTPTGMSSTKEFVVHGHDTAVRESVARFLERLGLEAVILHEQPNMGRTVIEKFEGSANVGFAVVLLTSDDMGASKEESAELRPRARQNVVLEMGYFAGKLGRSRVCVLYESGVELPSDINGLVYTSLTGDGWKLQLAKELKESGFAVDMNRAL